MKSQGDQSNRRLTYAQEFKLKQRLIRYFESPSEKVVAMLQEGRDMREGKMGEGSRSILVALIAATEKYERYKQTKEH